jgi:hypothetical protein
MSAAFVVLAREADKSKTLSPLEIVSKSLGNLGVSA